MLPLIPYTCAVALWATPLALASSSTPDDTSPPLLATFNSSEWRYVVPAAGEPMQHPPLQAVALTSNKPDDLREAVDFHGAKRWYAQLRYGTPNSTRVAVVIDELESGEFDLYVDLNRNRIIDAKERIDGNGSTRQLVLKTEVSQDGISEQLPRSVLIRRGNTGKTIEYATAGYVEGSVQIGERQISVRRVDGDGNGLFADNRDRIWFDLNQDGKWDDFSEQFPLTPVVVLGELRFAVRSDATGSRMTLEEIVGLGRIRLAVNSTQQQAKILVLDATLVGDDGSAFAIRNAGQGVALPVGRYALGSVTVAVEHPESKIPWQFVFSRPGRPAADQWLQVDKDQEVVANAIGALRFVLESRDLTGAVAPGSTIAVAPRLYTEHGLLINSTRCGKLSESYYDSGSTASVALQTTDGAALTSAKSGFA